MKSRYQFELSAEITVENLTQITFLRKREMESSSEATHLYSPLVFLPCMLSSDFLIFSQLILSSSQYNRISKMPRIKSHISYMLLESQKILNKIILIGSNNHLKILMKNLVAVDLTDA